MRRNAAGQYVGAQLINTTTGAPVTSGSTSVYVQGDASAQGIGTVGGGAATHQGNGYWTYAPAQAETDYTHVAFTFVNASSINVSVQTWPIAYDASGQMTGVSLTTDQAVNVTKVAGTSQTAVDIGARLDVAVSTRLAEASYSAPLDAAGTRGAVGLAAANLDTQLSGINAKTTNLPAAPAAVGDIPTAIQNADAVLARDIGSGTNAGTLNERTLRSALRQIRNKWTISAGVLTVYCEDDTTIAFTGTVVGSAGADPITSTDPA